MDIEPTYAEKELRLLLSPVPSGSFLNIQTNIPIDNFTKISIIDMFGKVVYLQKMISANETINTNNFADGIYFVTIQSKNKSVVQKFIVQR